MLAMKKLVELTERERNYLVALIKSLNPREDLIGAILSRTPFHLLGDHKTAVVDLAEKLEGPSATLEK